jgi:hypothetical protein
MDDERGATNQEGVEDEGSIYLSASQERLAQSLLGSFLYHMSPNTARLWAVFERRGLRCELEK